MIQAIGSMWIGHRKSFEERMKDSKGLPWARVYRTGKVRVAGCESGQMCGSVRAECDNIAANRTAQHLDVNAACCLGTGNRCISRPTTLRA